MSPPPRSENIGFIVEGDFAQYRSGQRPFSSRDSARSQYQHRWK